MLIEKIFLYKNIFLKMKKEEKSKVLKKIYQAGFTLVELLVVISIIAVLLGLSLFSLQGAKESGRNARRKSDLEMIRSGIELYKSDCGTYPLSPLPDPLLGDDSSSSCLSSNIYISEIPDDPQPAERGYIYTSNGIIYELCAALEGVTGTETCGGTSNCGEACNYRVTNP